MDWRKKRRIQQRIGTAIRKAEARTNQRIDERMRHLSNDTALTQEIDKELENCKSLNDIREYICSASQRAIQEHKETEQRLLKENEKV